MRLDRRFFIVMTLSLVWAFVVSAVFYRVIARRGPSRPPPETPLVVASQALPFGTIIKRESVKVTRVPAKLFPKGGFSRPEEVLERPVISPIQPEEPVVEARIAARGSGVGVAPLIPAGMRAISVRVNDVVGVAGFILPGMRVDVLVTGRPPGRDDTFTTTVLQNITVLSAGQNIQVDANKQAINTAVVTLLVTPAQAEAMALANNEGRIQLVLRNSTDQKLAQTLGQHLRELYHVGETPLPQLRPVSAPTPRPPAVAVPPAPEAPPEMVVVIRGTQKSLERLEPARGGAR
ncbi:MAG TPA: Flp pilus assembly protein CpaB [Bryobacteraceae bacterium]|nr:Flp pilus assembly protein CpaB [Bryobacteraceae bacterium]